MSRQRESSMYAVVAMGLPTRISAALLCAQIVLGTSGCSSHEKGDGSQPTADAEPAELGDVLLSDEPCAPVRPAVCPNPAPGFMADVQPILDARCASCHGRVAGVWPLHDYDDVADWQELVRAVLLDCTMPPADAGAGMSNDERTTVLTWLSCGLSP